jgi:hypothetical protein
VFVVLRLGAHHEGVSYQGVEVLCDYEPGGSAVCAQNDSSWFEHGIVVLAGEEMTLELVVLHSRGMREGYLFPFDSRPRSATYPFPQPSPATTTANDFDEPLGPMHHVFLCTSDINSE